MSSASDYDSDSEDDNKSDDDATAAADATADLGELRRITNVARQDVIDDAEDSANRMQLQGMRL